MKNIYSLKEFKTVNENVNEGTLLGKAFRSMIKKVFSKIDQKLASTMQDFMKKVEGKQDIKEVVPYVNTFIETTNKYLEDELENSGDIVTARKVVAETSITIFDSMQTLSNQFKNEALKAKNLLKDSKYKPIFDYDSMKGFNKNLTKNVNNFLFSVAQVSGLDKNYVKDQFKEPIQFDSNESLVSEKKSGFETSGLGITGSKPVSKAPSGNLPKVKNPVLDDEPKEVDEETIKKLKGVDEDEHLLEAEMAGSEITSEQGQGDNKEAQDAEDQNTKDQNADKNAQEENQVTEEQLNKFKETVTTIFKQNILGEIFKKFKTPDKFTEGDGNTAKEVQDVAKTMTGSNNMDSKKNLLNTIASKADTAGKLADVRDAIAKPLGIKNPQKSIGKF